MIVGLIGGSDTKLHPLFKTLPEGGVTLIFEREAT